MFFQWFCQFTIFVVWILFSFFISQLFFFISVFVWFITHFAACHYIICACSGGPSKTVAVLAKLYRLMISIYLNLNGVWDLKMYIYGTVVQFAECAIFVVNTIYLPNGLPYCMSITISKIQKWFPEWFSLVVCFFSVRSIRVCCPFLHGCDDLIDVWR